MHKKKINRKYLFTVMFLMLSSGLFCGCSSKRKRLYGIYPNRSLMV